MKKQKLIYLIIIIIILSTLYNCSQPKSSPGLYVNSRPPYSVSYPSNWEEVVPNDPNCVFRVDSPDGLFSFWFLVIPNINLPIRGSANAYKEGIKQAGGRDIELIHEKEIQLNDGSWAYETEFECTFQTKQNNFYLTVKERDTWVVVSIISTKGRVNEDLKKKAYTLKKRAEEKTEAWNRLVRVYFIVSLALLIMACIFILLLRMKRSAK